MRTTQRCQIALVLLAMAACSAKSPKPAQQVNPVAGNDDPARVQALWRERTAGGTRTEPCLGPGDLLEISIFRLPDLQGFRTRVSPAGTIALPLLGAVKAAGLT